MEEDEHVKALSAEELAALLDRLPERWRLFFEFLAEMGLRVGEAIELRWSDSTWGRRRFTFGGCSTGAGSRGRRDGRRGG